MPGQRWWTGFLKRHPMLSVRKPQALQISRVRAAQPEVINHWFFAVLKPLLQKLDLLDCPQRIFNADETSFNLCGRLGHEKLWLKKVPSLPNT